MLYTVTADTSQNYFKNKHKTVYKTHHSAYSVQYSLYKNLYTIYRIEYTKYSIRDTLYCLQYGAHSIKKIDDPVYSVQL